MFSSNQETSGNLFQTHGAGQQVGIERVIPVAVFFFLNSDNSSAHLMGKISSVARSVPILVSYCDLR